MPEKAHLCVFGDFNCDDTLTTLFSSKDSRTEWALQTTLCNLNFLSLSLPLNITQTTEEKNFWFKAEIYTATQNYGFCTPNGARDSLAIVTTIYYVLLKKLSQAENFVESNYYFWNWFVVH